MKKKQEPVTVLPKHLLIGKILFIAACVLAMWAGLLSIVKYLMDIDVLTPYSTALYFLLLLLAALYALYPLFKGYAGKRVASGILRDYFCKDQVILFVFILWSIVCCMSMSSRYGSQWFGYNKKVFRDVVIALLVIFPLGRKLGKNGFPAALKWIFLVSALALSVFMGYVIITVCKPAIITLPNGFQIGMDSAGRLSIHCNANTTGLYAATILGGCLLAGIFSKNRIVKALWLLMCPVHYFILVLSGSRSAYMAAAVILAGVAAAAFYSRSREKNRKAFLTAFFIFAAVMTAVYFLRIPFDRLYERISHLREHLGINEEGRDFGLTDFSGRGVIYGFSLKAIVRDARSFLFGNTPEGVVPVLEAVSEGAVSQMYTHNQFLEIAVATGIPGLAVFCWWEVRQAIRSVRLFLRNDEKVDTAMRLVPFAILMCAAANLAEATLLWYGFFNAYFFFFLCGWVCGAEEKLTL